MKLTKILNEDKNLYKGIFWIVDLDNLESNKNYCFTINSDINGNPLVDRSMLNSKNGETFNHKATWEKLPKQYTHNKPFDYYPRGRVEINNGTATIYLNPNIANDDVKEFIINTFNLTESNGINKVRLFPDGSSHYECYLDKE